MLAYRLAPQVRVCATDEGAVLLDVDDDKYLSLDPDQACALSLVVDAWPSGCERGDISNSAVFEGHLQSTVDCIQRNILVVVPVRQGRSEATAGPLAFA